MVREEGSVVILRFFMFLILILLNNINFRFNLNVFMGVLVNMRLMRPKGELFPFLFVGLVFQSSYPLDFKLFPFLFKKK